MKHVIPVGPGGIHVETDDSGGGSISSDLKESCPVCNQYECYADCDGSQMDEETAKAHGVAYESEEEIASRRDFNAAVDGMEALILSLACAGPYLETPEFTEAVQTAYDAIGNQFAE